MKKSLILLALVLSFSCNSTLNDKPKNLLDCYKLLDMKYSNTEKESIIASSNDEMMIKYHYGIGLFIRNEWIRHGNSKLIGEINPKGYRVQIDDIGMAVLKGYWHYLHKESFDSSNYLLEMEKYYNSKN